MPAQSSGAAAAGSMPSGTRQDVVGVDDDVGGVAALGGGAVAVGAGVGGDHALEAVLLVAVAAVGALAAGVDHAADADAVADPVAGDVGADLGDDADDLVAGDDGEGLRAPVAVDGVDVGVADAGVLDLDQDVVRVRRHGARWWWGPGAGRRRGRRRR